MKRLELTKGLSYSTKGLDCKKGKSFVVSDEQAEMLMTTGRFATVEEIVEDVHHTGTLANGEREHPVTGEDSRNGQQIDTMPASDTTQLSADKISRMKKDELLALAEQNNINIEDCKNNEERAERIQNALELTNFAQMFED